MTNQALSIVDMSHPTKVKIHETNFQTVLNKVGSLPFVLISVNGATRTGKSYALNHFIRYFEAKKAGISDWFNSCSADEFQWRSGLDRMTVGINIWSEPYFVKSLETEVAILLMDCQGLFDKETTARQNAIIFSLSTLCSSISIYNLKQNVDENVLQQLQFYTGYANMSSTDASLQSTQNESFQNLIFLLRDFDLVDYEYGYHDRESKPMNSAKNFFRDVFLLDQENGRNVAEENILTREKIISCYNQVGTFLLPDPGKKFRRNSTAPTEPDFNEHLQGFVEQLVNSRSLVTKKIGGEVLTGLEFIKHIDKWAKLCANTEKHFPDVMSVAQATAAIQNSNAAENGVSLYKKCMEMFLSNNPGVPDDELNSAHLIFEKKANEIFERMPRFNNDQVKDKYEKKLLKEIEKLFEANQRVNHTQKKARLEKEKFYRAEKERELELKHLEKLMSETDARNKREMEIMQGRMKFLQQEADRERKSAEEKQKQLEEEAKKVKTEKTVSFFSSLVESLLPVIKEVIVPGISPRNTSGDRFPSSGSGTAFMPSTPSSPLEMLGMRFPSASTRLPYQTPSGSPFPRRMPK